MKKRLISILLVIVLVLVPISSMASNNIVDLLEGLSEEDTQSLYKLLKEIVEKDNKVIDKKIKKDNPFIVDKKYANLGTDKWGHMKVLTGDSYRDIVDGETFLDAGISNPIYVTEMGGLIYFIDSHRNDYYLRVIKDDYKVETVGLVSDLIYHEYVRVTGLVQANGKMFLTTESSLYVYNEKSKDFSVFGEELNREMLGPSGIGWATSLSTNGKNLYILLNGEGVGSSIKMINQTGSILQVDASTAETRHIGKVTSSKTVPEIAVSTSGRTFAYRSWNQVYFYTAGDLSGGSNLEGYDNYIFGSVLYYNDYLLSVVNRGVVSYKDGILKPWIGDLSSFDTALYNPRGVKPFASGVGNKVGLGLKRGIRHWSVGEDGCIYAILYGSGNSAKYSPSIIRLVPPKSLREAN